jgi:hypothetical protein
LVCPFDGCVSGINGKPSAIRPEDISRLRQHLSEHMSDGFVPSAEWLSEHDSRLCPGCEKAVVLL